MPLAFFYIIFLRIGTDHKERKKKKIN